MPPLSKANLDRAEMPELGDAELVAHARRGNEAAIRTIVRRYNQRLFRVTRAILRSDSEAEDAVQASYVSAFTHLDGFRGDAQLATWLTRIAINEANGRLRRHHPVADPADLDRAPLDSAEIIQFPLLGAQPDPEAEMSRQEVRLVIERAIDTLPEPFRVVFVLRDIEGLSVEETAAELSIQPETVKTRLYRARRRLRAAIAEELSGAFSAVFPFDGARCVHMADRVILELRNNK
jgi:RNA polymerase sigma-70 factor (ECF subfamily)